MFFLYFSVSEKILLYFEQKTTPVLKHHLYKECTCPIFSVLITVALKPPLVDQ
jgi:hypothetical protein